VYVCVCARAYVNNNSDSTQAAHARFVRIFIRKLRLLLRVFSSGAACGAHVDVMDLLFHNREKYAYCDIEGNYDFICNSNTEFTTATTTSTPSSPAVDVLQKVKSSRSFFRRVFSTLNSADAAAAFSCCTRAIVQNVLQKN